MKSMTEMIKEGSLTLQFGDTFTIKSTKNCITNTINVNFKRIYAETEHMSFPNTLESWAFLRRVGENAHVTVYYVDGDGNCMLYTESLPYRHRFNS